MPVRAESPRHEIHPALAQGASRHRRVAAGDRRQAHHDWARGRECRGQGKPAQAVRDRIGNLGRKAPERGSPARLHGGHRRRQADPGRVRRAQCACRHEGRVLRARHLHSRQEHHADRRHHSRRRKPRHVVFGGGADDLRRPRRHHRVARRCAGRKILRRMGRRQRSGNRDQSHAQPAGLHRRQRHRPRPRRRRHRRVQGSPAEAGEGHVSLPGEGHARFRQDAAAVPGLRPAAGQGHQERPVAGLAAEAVDGDRPSPDQCAGRYHQLHHLRPRPPAACV